MLLVYSAPASAAGCPNATFVGFDGSLPDCRAYEQVSPTSDQEVYVLSHGRDAEEDINTGMPFRASSDGSAVTYVGDPPSSGEGGNGNTGKGGGNQYLATRDGTGWKATDITPAKSSTAVMYEAFSSDLSVGILATSAFDEPLSPAAPLDCPTLYARASSDGSFQPLFTAGQVAGGCEEEEAQLYAGASTDDSRLLFQSSGVLTDEAAEAEGHGRENLYESFHGVLRSVNILGGLPDPNATIGGPKESPPKKVRPDFDHAISADGRRVYWTDLNTGQIYVRVDGTTTVPVSVGPARFWTASPDGRFAYYTEEEAPEEAKLIRFDLQSEAREEVVAATGRVQGVIGVNEGGEGEYVYFVAQGALAGNANSHGDEAVSGQPNVYLRHEGVVTFIATLAPQDNSFLGPSEAEVGDWRASLGDRTANLTPDGRDLVFESTRPLTGYDNNALLPEEKTEVALPEVFIFDVVSGQISCVSCNPSGVPPTERLSGPSPDALQRAGAFVPANPHATYMLRWMSDDGRRVFFDTSQPLVPQDTNGRLDVYEWEREGSGSCPAGRPSGCVFLLSGGSSIDESDFVDASADGNDVFFTTRGQLVSRDRDQKIDLYDARIDGGFPEVSLACTGTGCQGVPPAPPTFATPPSVTFNGVGNFPPPPPPKKPSAAEIRAKRFAQALKTCRVRRNRRRRAICEARVGRRYGPVRKAKRSNGRGK